MFNIVPLFNTNRDALFGDGYTEGDKFTRSLHFGEGGFDIDSGTVAIARADAWMMLNADNRPNGQVERSLSVGDALVVRDEERKVLGVFVVKPIGWEEIPKAELESICVRSRD